MRKDIPNVLQEHLGRTVLGLVNVQTLISMTAMMVLLEMGDDHVDLGLSRNVEVNGWSLVQRVMSINQVA